MNIEEKQKEIIEEFELLEDWPEKYRYIIEMGQSAPDLPDEIKTEERKIKGCQSNVWLYSYLEGDKVIYKGDSDAMITKGLINLLTKTLSGERPEDIVKADLFFISRLGLQQHLSPTRANGLSAMVKQMKLDAMAYTMV